MYLEGLQELCLMTCAVLTLRKSFGLYSALITHYLKTKEEVFHLQELHIPYVLIVIQSHFLEALALLFKRLVLE
jgi:hypothetical protein